MIIYGNSHYTSGGGHEKMKLVVFGTGRYYQNRKNEFFGEDIIAFLDNDLKKKGFCIDDAPIYTPGEVLHLNYDYIVLMSGDVFREEMHQQLIEIGINEDKILDYEHFIEMKGASAVMFYDFLNTAEYGKKVLMISHELTNTGAPIVLLYFARVLKNMGYFPVITCEKDGELKKEIIAEGIPLVIEKNISRKNKFVWDWVETFEMIILNTLETRHLIREFNDCGKPVLWWLHEVENAYELCKQGSLPKQISENVSVFGVGEKAIEAYKKYFGNENISNLIYGIPDFRGMEYGWTERKIIFAVIGTIMERKGQDIFVDSLQYLSKEVRNKAEFWIIGRVVEQELQDYIDSKAQMFHEIKVLGDFTVEQMQEIYKKIDVVVSPSRKDPMPVVLVEGMMNHKVCIASEATGTSELICDKKDGLVCKVDAMDLADKINWVIHHRGELRNIGDEARKLYEKQFALQTFEKKITDIFEKI